VLGAGSACVVLKARLYLETRASGAGGETHAMNFYRTIASKINSK
jgi:hypothetical protein